MKKNEVAKIIDDGLSEGMSFQEISWCETFLRTASVRQACKEALLDLRSSREMLQKPIVKRYIISKSQMYKNDDSLLTREDIKKVLNNIAQDPTTPPDLRVKTIIKLNDMMEFDTEHKEELVSTDDGNLEEIKITSDEAEELLRKIREDKTKV